jgi:hypothetical protein
MCKQKTEALNLGLLLKNMITAFPKRTESVKERPHQNWPERSQR